MNFYESLVNGCSEDLEANAALKKKEKLELIAELMNTVTCQALADIRSVLDDESLDDRSCFERIEKIVRIYEAMGSDGGTRHDF